MTATTDPEKWTEEQRSEWKRAYLASEPVVMPAPGPDHELGECDWCDVLWRLLEEAEAERKLSVRRADRR